MSGYIDDRRFENVELRFTNFAGRERKFNKEGERNFVLVVPDEVAEEMIEEGWNVKQYVNEERGISYYKLPVKIRFDKKPPRVVWKCSEHPEEKIKCDESMIGFLDEIDVDRFDVTINPYRHDNGVTAYLKRLTAYIPSEELDYVV